VYSVVTHGIFLRARQAIFVISPDEALAPKGIVTKLQYEEMFNGYKQILIRKADTRRIQELFQFYNRIVFITTPENFGSGDEGIQLDLNNLDAVMHALDDSSEDEYNDDHTAPPSLVQSSIAASATAAAHTSTSHSAAVERVALSAGSSAAAERVSPSADNSVAMELAAADTNAAPTVRFATTPPRDTPPIRTARGSNSKGKRALKSALRPSTKAKATRSKGKGKAPDGGAAASDVPQSDLSSLGDD
jgi:hypothetical protein